MILKAYRVSGISMEPSLREGDYVVVVKAKYKEGDVVVFKEDGMTLIKRVKKVGEKICLEGDNRIFKKRWEIEKEKIIGKAMLKISRNGSISFLKS
ncbi:MAG: S24/S26 family peptidase [Candidatus Micrarchaeaceae archaeon]